MQSPDIVAVTLRKWLQNNNLRLEELAAVTHQAHVNALRSRGFAPPPPEWRGLTLQMKAVYREVAAKVLAHAKATSIASKN